MSISKVSTWTLWTRSTSVVSVAPRVTGRGASPRALSVCAAPIQSIARSASDVTTTRAFFTLPTLSRCRPLWITWKGEKKKARLSAGLPLRRGWGLLGETREDRLCGGVRVVVDRDVALLDLDLPRDELATAERGVVAVEHEQSRWQIDRARSTKGAISADLEGVRAQRILEEEQVLPNSRGHGRQHNVAVTGEGDVAAGGTQPWAPRAVAVRVEDEDVSATYETVAGRVEALLNDVDAGVHTEDIVTC